MKVALVHDYIKEYGGAERVLEALHELFPETPIFTTVYLPEYLGPHRKRVASWDIHPLKLFSWIPFRGKILSPLRLFAPFFFRLIDLSVYDVVIVSAAGTYTSPNFVKVGESTLHICYCHTPPRYLYGYATAAAWDKVWWRKMLKGLGVIPMHFLRLYDFKAAQRPDYFIANSEEVKARIKKFYRRDAIVINPPVDIHPHMSSPRKRGSEILDQVENDKEYYLAGGRLARPKHIDLIVKTFTKLNKRLIVFGKSFAGYGDELVQVAGQNITFVGEVTDEEKVELMGGAKAFVFAAEDEDFGITPIEAMSVGTPVIAYKSGGVKETVQDGKTGLFFDTLAVGSLSMAITKFEKSKFNEEEIKDYAKKFSKERFKKEIQDFVSEKLKA